MTREIKLGNKLVGDGHPAYVIAEIGINHNGDLEIAKQMIKAAAHAGADAVKFQTFQVDKLLNPLVFQENNSESNWVYDELKKVEIDEEFHKKIKEKCVQLKIDFISSPFDTESLEIVSKYCDKIKIASSEITNLPFLKEVGKYGKPVILYDASSKGAINHMNLAREILQRNKMTYLGKDSNIVIN